MTEAIDPETLVPVPVRSGWCLSTRCPSGDCFGLGWYVPGRGLACHAHAVGWGWVPAGDHPLAGDADANRGVR